MLVVLGLTFLAVGAVAPGAAPAAVTRPPIPHPTQPNAVIFRITSTLNFFGGAYDNGEAITIAASTTTGTIAGGGLVTIVPGYAEPRTRPQGTDGRPLGTHVVHVDEAVLQKVLRRARRVGLLGSSPPDTGAPLVTDQGTTTTEVHAGGVDRTIDVYALLLPEGDRGLHAKERRVRRWLRAFIHDLRRPVYYRVSPALEAPATN